MRRFCAAFALITLVFFSVVPLSRATQVLFRSPQQLGRDATLVVQGKVGDIRSFWNDKHSKVFTETRIDIDRSFKGTAPASLRILQLGGIVGTMKVTVHGAVQWRDGEEVLLFLEPYVDGSFQVSGFSQGKFDVERDEDGRPFVRMPALDGVQLVGAPKDRTTATRASQLKSVPLDRFVNQALGHNK